MFKSSFIVMTINMLSRILGLVREMIIGSLFGASGLTDAYFAAAKFSNLFTSLFGEGSLGTVVIPLYNEKSKKETRILKKNVVMEEDKKTIRIKKYNI